MRCGFADCSWEFWALDFVVSFSEKCLFFVFILDAIFSFSRTVWLVKKS